MDQQRGYARPPAGGQAPYMGIQWETGQGMPVGAANHMSTMVPHFASYPPMMMASGPMVPMPMHSMGMPPQITHMLATQLSSTRRQNVFFKTRLCNKWRAGSCPFGDKCTYAHGQHELRYIPPELLAHLEREQQLQEQGQSPGPGPSQGQSPGHPTQQAAPGQQQQYYKTRLCIRYMQTGFCARGSACSFAHGYEDLRATGAQGPSPHHPPQQQQQPRPPPAESQLQRASPRAQPARDNGINGGPATWQRPSPQVERARAVSALTGIGQAAAAADEAAIQEAQAAVRSGAAFQDNAYSDSVAGL